MYFHFVSFWFVPLPEHETDTMVIKAKRARAHVVDCCVAAAHWQLMASFEAVEHKRAVRLLREAEQEKVSVLYSNKTIQEFEIFKFK